MKFEMHPNETVQDIQQKFNKLFNYLKIEFYKTPHQESQASDKKEQYLHNTPIREIYKQDSPIVFQIDPSMTTANFEQILNKDFGLHVQLMRLQRGTWLQTTQSDELTLKAQNDRGMAADIHIENTDYRDE